MYELYAWGLPIIITFVGVFFDNFPAAADNERFIRPRFGERKCWFYGEFIISRMETYPRYRLLRLRLAVVAVIYSLLHRTQANLQ